MNRQQTEVFSIFGQIEQVAAESMIQRHGLYRIEPADIPETARVNDEGQVAKFAVIMPRRLVWEFNDTIARLRA